MTALAHAYVVLVSRFGDLPDNIADEIAERAKPYLPFVATDRMIWHSRNRRVALLCLAGQSTVDVGSYWDVTEHGAVCFSGLPVFRRGWWLPTLSWAAQVRQAAADSSIDRASADAFGVFTMLALDEEGHGTIRSDPLGVAALYAADGSRWTAIATRASLAGIAAHHPAPLRPDLGHLGWLFAFDNVVGEGTGYADVRALPARSVVHIGADARVSALAVPEPDCDAHERGEAAVDEISAHVCSVSQALKPRVGLTGGRDSRLVLAHILAAGVRDNFQFITWDLNASDVAVASELAHRYELNHSVIAVPTPTSLLDALTSMLQRTDGMIPATEAGKIMADDGVFMSGLAGELFSAEYGKQRSIKNLDDVRAIFQQRMRRPSEQTLCKQTTIDRYSEAIGQIIESYLGVDVERVPALIYLDQRLHRWQGTVRESAPRADVAPLLSPHAVTGALQISHDARRRYAWHEQLWARTVPELAALPFGDGPGRDVWPDGTWRTTAELSADVLLGDPSNPVFDLIEKGRVVQALSAEELPDHNIRKQLLNAIGLALWARQPRTPV